MKSNDMRVKSGPCSLRRTTRHSIRWKQAAPIVIDGNVTLAESGAIVQYIIAKYGGGRLTLRAEDPDFAEFLYWFHFANATLQAKLGRLMILNQLQLRDNNPVLLAIQARVDRALHRGADAERDLSSG